MVLPSPVGESVAANLTWAPAPRAPRPGGSRVSSPSLPPRTRTRAGWAATPNARNKWPRPLYWVASEMGHLKPLA